MKTIVVLDAHTLSPLQLGEHSAAHPSWDKLASLGSLTLHSRTKPDDVVARAADAEILLTNKAKVTAEHIAALPNLKYIGVMATGYNIVDLAAARARGIPVTNVPGYSTMSVAQHVFALLLEIAVKAGAHDAAVKNGDWVRCPDFYFSVGLISELAGKTLGIIGLGTIGQAVARIGAAFGMRIVTYSRSRKEFDTPVEWLSLDEVFAQSDVLTLHCPLTPETDHFINRENLKKFKSTAILINTSRGPLVNEADLAEALKNGTLAAYGTDVLSEEPPRASNPLLSAPNTVITPHSAWASVEARTRLMNVLADNLNAFIAGAPINVVNGTAAAQPAPVEPQAAEQTPVEPPPVEEPAAEQPIVEQPILEQTATEELAVEPQAFEPPTVEEPAFKEPVAEQPFVAEPVVEEPIPEQPAVEEAVVDQSSDESPTLGETFVDEVGVEEFPIGNIVIEPTEEAAMEAAPESPGAGEPLPVDSRFWNFRPSPRRRIGQKASSRFKRVRQAATAAEPESRQSRRAKARKKQR